MTFVYCSQNHANPAINRYCSHCGTALPLPDEEILQNRYRIKRQIGQGGFGRTYLAEDIARNNEFCVLKEFAPQEHDPQYLQKAEELFDREADALSKLTHPQIPRLRDKFRAHFRGQEHRFLVQDYVEGETYCKLLEERQAQNLRFTEDEVRQLLLNILPVLEYIHSRNPQVIHRDISPDNLMRRNGDGKPVLIDFGGVKQLKVNRGFWRSQLGGAIQRTLLGKEDYAPEEQLRTGEIFPNSDLYALAVTILVLLTGQEPKNLYNGYNAVWRWGMVNISPELQAVLQKMLAYQPSDRYTSAQEVIQALQSPSVTVSSIPTPQPHVTGMRTLVVAPGVKAFNNSIPSSNPNSITRIIAPLTQLSSSTPRWGLIVGATSLVLLTGMGAWGVLNSVIRTSRSTSVTTKKPDTQLSASEKTQINRILTRRKALKIPQRKFNARVNERFYNEHPDLNKRLLNRGKEDEALRKEWNRIAEEELDKLERGE